LNSYSSLLGKRIEVAYRFGPIDLFALGVLMGYSEDSIIIEQDADQYGAIPVLTLKIPYTRIIRMNECLGGHSDSTSDPGGELKKNSRSN
jgi:hypothetical protein